MELLKQKILTDGKVLNGEVLNVSGFLNHRIDTELMIEVGKEFYNLFKDCGITKILTIEASGIGVACFTAAQFGVPVVYAKKGRTKNIIGDVYSCKVESFTHGNIFEVMVSKEFISPDDKILIIDDMLANGSALLGLINIIRSSGAELCGAGVVIEKGFSLGGEIVRSMGVRLESLAIIDSMDENGVTFRN